MIHNICKKIKTFLKEPNRKRENRLKVKIKCATNLKNQLK